MSDPETRLDRALKASAPAPRDPMFRVEVLARRERNALRRRMLAAGVMAFAVALLAVLLSTSGLGTHGELAAIQPWRLMMVAGVSVALAVALTAGALGGAWRAGTWTLLRAMARPLIGR